MCAPLLCLRPLADAEHAVPARAHGAAAAMASQTASTPGLPLSYGSGADDSNSNSGADDSSRELPPAGAAARVLGMFAGVAPVVPQIHEEFEVPRSEVLLFDAACALKERHLLLQGRLYIFQTRAAFFSSVFGVVHKLVMPFDEITAIRRTSSRRVFGAVEIVYGPSKVVLTSFWDRDKAATALLDAWLASGAPAARLFMDAMEKLGNVATSVRPAASAVPQRGDAVSSESGESGESEVEPHDAHDAHDADAAAHELAKAAPDEDAASSLGPTAEHLGSLLDAARQTHEPLLSPPAPVVPSQLGGGDALAPIPQLLPSACAAAPPAPPAEGAAPLPVAPGGEVEAELDCSPAEFFALFLADGSRFTEAFRSARGEREVAVQPWRDDTGGAACRRVVTFLAPLDAMKGIRLPGIPRSTRIREEQRCVFHDCAGSGEGAPALVVLDSCSAQLDIPFGDSFVLESRLQLRARDGGVPKCAASVAFMVRWLKTPPRMPGIKGKIESQSRESSAEAFRTMLAMAQGYLARWQQAAAAAGAKRAPKKRKAGGGGAVSSNPRLEAALERLDAATAEDIRAALGLTPAPGGQAVTEAAPSPTSANNGDGDASSSPRRKAAELAALRQSLVPSSAVAFGAVVDALQLAAAALNESATPKADGGDSAALQPGLRRAVVALTLLAAMLLAAALSYLMGLRRGSHQAALPVLPCDTT